MVILVLKKQSLKKSVKISNFGKLAKGCPNLGHYQWGTLPPCLSMYVFLMYLQ